MPSMFEFSHGDHTCVFYPSPSALLRVLAPYIAQGLRKGERCFCIQQPDTVRALANDLRFLGINVERQLATGALEFHTCDELYCRDSRFDPESLIEMLSCFIDDAPRRGFTAFRSAGDMYWAVEGRNECDRVLGYEAEVQRLFPGKPALGMCLYPIQRFEPHVLQRVQDVHIATIVPAVSYVSMQIAQGHYQAEIVAKSQSLARCYHYVVTHAQTREPLAWGSAETYEAAANHVKNRIGKGSWYREEMDNR